MTRLYRDKKRGTYYGDFRDKARGRKRVSLGTRDKTAARSKLVDLERKQALGLWNPWEDAVQKGGVTVQAAVDAFVKDRARSCAASTVETYRYVLDCFAGSLPPGLLAAHVAERHVTDFLTLPQHAGRLADATRESYRNRIAAFFSWCKKEGYAAHSPVPELVRKGKRHRVRQAEKEKPPPFFSERQFTQLVAAIEADAEEKGITGGNRWLLDVCLVAVSTGLRRDELRHLLWQHVDFERGVLRVENWSDEATKRSFSTKSGRHRVVPLVGDALAVLQRRHSDQATGPKEEAFGGGYALTGATGGQIGKGYVSKRFREYRRLAMLPEELHFHSLRHTFASWFVQRKGDLYHLKEIMGHADMKTTLRYAHLRPDALRAEMDQTFGQRRFTDSHTESRVEAKGSNRAA